MTIKEAAEQIKKDWQRILPQLLPPAKIKVNGQNSFICPFCGHGTHGDGLTYNPDSKNYGLHCFGSCQFTGSDIDLYMQMQGIQNTTEGFIQAVKELAALDGLIIDNYGSDNAARETRPQTAPQAAPQMAEENTKPQPGHYKAFIEECAANVAGAAAYLEGRGLTTDSIKNSNLGYNKAQKFYDKETGQYIEAEAVIFPYNGDYSYYAARSLNGKLFYKPNKKEAGSEPLYNIQALYAGDPCFICEGIIDAISIIQAGGSAAACNGTGSDKFIAQVQEQRPTSPIILCFDNDTANEQGHRPGQEAQKKCAAALQAMGIPYTEAMFSLDKYNGPQKDANDLLNTNAEQLREDIKANISAALPVTKIGQFLADIYTEKYKPVSTGIKSLDKLLHGGFIPQTLILLGAEPGAGKTALASMIFENMAKAGQPGLYFNLEMSESQLIARSISRIAYTNNNWPIDALDVLQGYRQEEMTRGVVQQAAGIYEKEIEGRLQYVDTEKTGAGVTEILKYMYSEADRALAAGKPVPNVCLDYLQIMTGEGREDPTEIIKRAIAGLKGYAKKYNAIVLAIMAQSRRANESKQATMTAGRDTSAIEYTSDLQIQLLRENEEDNNEITLHITKSRFTQTNMHEGIKFNFRGGQSLFEEAGEWTQGSISPFDNDGQEKRHRY